MVRLLPNPAEGNAPLYERWPSMLNVRMRFPSRHAQIQTHVLAHVFKVEIDPYVGKVSVIRVHQGTIGPDTQLMVGESRKPVRMGQLFRLLGKQHVPITRAVPGDICAMAKVDEIHFDAVLHDAPEDDPYYLRPLDFRILCLVWR
jgi:elongation factor G